MKGKSNSLYIHIPFCVKKCIYCDFLSVPYDEALAVRYMDSVIGELDLRRNEAGTLKTAYVGGGTPTTVPVTALVRLLRKVRDSFRMARDAEITIEANPGTMGTDTADMLSDAGINRFSIGVQSFQNEELKLLGRIHSSQEAIKAVADARRAGIANISIDLIYGMPGQTPDGWLRTVETAVELSPEHISAYELTPEKGTPLYELISQGRIEKPDEESIIEMYYSAIDRLNEAGYNHYEISNFAKPGFECRHNLNYWDRGEYIGIGAGAHGFIGNRRMRNTGDINEYANAIAEGRLAVEESNEISGEDAVRESIFLGLRKMEGLNAKELMENLRVDVEVASKELIAEGLLESDGIHILLTRKGIVISNTVIARLLEALEKRMIESV
jgi:oxygen-independent coproporphyrinogen III oxidase